jgi:hypothetical protein
VGQSDQRQGAEGRLKALGREPTLDEWRRAYEICLKRYHAIQARKAVHSHGHTPATARRDFETNVFGALAEWYVAMRTGRRWLSDGTSADNGRADVDPIIETRWSEFDGVLMLWMNDNPSRPFVRVGGFPPLEVLDDAAHAVGARGHARPPYLHALGWREGSWIMQPKYFVPKGQPIPGFNKPRGADSYCLPVEWLIDEPLHLLMLYEGQDPNELIARLANPFELDKWVGRCAFDIDYGDGISYSRT